MQVWFLGWNDPLERKWQPTPIFLLGKYHGQMSLVSYSLWSWTRVRHSLETKFNSVVSDSLRPHGLQHARPPCPSPAAGAYSDSCPSSRWCHPTISSSVIPFSSCLQSFPAWGSFQMSQFFASGGQRIGVSASASVLPVNGQHWFPLGWTGRISLQSKQLTKQRHKNTLCVNVYFLKPV